MKDLYTYTKIAKEDDDFNFDVSIDPKHTIFEGHFPGNAILPGVCQVQIVKDVFLTQFPEYSCILSSKAIKFLHIINPNEINMFKLNFKIKNEGDSMAKEKIKVTAKIFDDENVYLKMYMLIAKSY